MTAAHPVHPVLYRVFSEPTPTIGPSPPDLTLHEAVAMARRRAARASRNTTWYVCALFRVHDRGPRPYYFEYVAVPRLAFPGRRNPRDFP